MLVRVVDGSLKKGERIKLMASRKEYEVLKVGVFTPHPVAINELTAGEVGFITASIKVVQDAKVGDTITHVRRPAEKALPGFKEVKPMVFSGLYPVDSRRL